MDISPGSQISCNKIKEIGVCMKFQGPQPSDIYNNYLNYDTPTMPSPCLFGIWLNNQGFIDDQDWPGTNGMQPSDNRFGDYVLGTPPFGDLFSDGLSTGSIIYWRDNGFPNIWKPQTNISTVGSTNFPLDSINTSLQALQNCTSIPPGLFNKSQQIAQDQITFNANDQETRFMNKRGLYQHVKRNNLNVSSDAVLFQFMQQGDVSNYGKMLAVDTLLESGIRNNDAMSYVTAKNINSGISIGLSPEANQKQVNEMYANYRLNNTLTAAELSTLKYLAGLCPFYDGTAVYQARSLLGINDTLLYHNPCEFGNLPSSGSRIGKNASGGPAISIFPNPAKNELNVIFISEVYENGVFELYDVLGKLVMQESLNTSSSNLLQIDEFESGIYTYRIVSNNFFIQTGKLFIAK